MMVSGMAGLGGRLGFFLIFLGSFFIAFGLLLFVLKKTRGSLSLMDSDDRDLLRLGLSELLLLDSMGSVLLDTISASSASST